MVGGSEIAAGAVRGRRRRVAEAVPRGRARPGGGRCGDPVRGGDSGPAFVAFAAAGVEVAVIEAGLGGRLDATNVIPSRVTALTSIGLEHTEYLGETALEIAAEKLAVLQRPLDARRSARCRPRGQRPRPAHRRRARRPVHQRRRAGERSGPGRPRARTCAGNLAVARGRRQSRSTGPLDPATGRRGGRRGAASRGAWRLRAATRRWSRDAAHNPDGAQRPRRGPSRRRRRAAGRGLHRDPGGEGRGGDLGAARPVARRRLSSPRFRP